jgi:hypothetical protein
MTAIKSAAVDCAHTPPVKEASMSLVPCPSCGRHVRPSERACPFCASALPDDLASRVRPIPRGFVSRAAMMLFASTLGTAGAVGCSSDSTTTTPPADTGVPSDTAGDAIDTMPAPAYGVPWDSSIDTSVDTGVDSAPTDAKPTDANDAGDSADTMPAPAYGLPIDAAGG